MADKMLMTLSVVGVIGGLLGFSMMFFGASIWLGISGLVVAALNLAMLLSVLVRPNP